MEPEVLCTLITRFKRISSRVKICLKGGKRKKGKGRKEEQSWPRYSRITPGAWYKATEYGPRNKYEGNQACSSAYLLITQKIITHLARGSKKWDFAWMITPVAWIFYRRAIFSKNQIISCSPSNYSSFSSIPGAERAVKSWQPIRAWPTSRVFSSVGSRPRNYTGARNLQFN